MIKEDSFRVKLVEDSISIALMARSKDNDFPTFFHSLQKSYCIRSNVKTNIKRISINIDGEFDISFSLGFLKAMHKRFI
jgi:hypothetical protein